MLHTKITVNAIEGKMIIPGKLLDQVAIRTIWEVSGQIVDG